MERALLNQRYRLISPLKEGGMAIVYLCFDERLSRRVALKMIKPEFCKDHDLTLRFRQEGILLANLKHPNIVSVYDVGTAQNGSIFIVTELLDGWNLYDLTLLMQSSGKKVLPLEILLCIVHEITLGLEVAHKSGIIHRDVKPENILLSSHGEVKLVDFGIAKNVRLNQTLKGQYMGSPSYSSPEQISNETMSATSDIFVLGIVLYEGITGRLPFKGGSPFQAMTNVQKAVYVPISQIFPQVDKELEALVDCCLMRNPLDRFQSASLLGENLAKFLLEQLDVSDPKKYLEMVAPRLSKVAEKVQQVDNLRRGAGNTAPPVLPHRRIFVPNGNSHSGELEKTKEVLLDAAISPQNIRKYKAVTQFPRGGGRFKSKDSQVTVLKFVLLLFLVALVGTFSFVLIDSKLNSVRQKSTKETRAKALSKAYTNENNNSKRIQGLASDASVASLGRVEKLGFETKRDRPAQKNLENLRGFEGTSSENIEYSSSQVDKSSIHSKNFEQQIASDKKTQDFKFDSGNVFLQTVPSSVKVFDGDLPVTFDVADKKRQALTLQPGAHRLKIIAMGYQGKYVDVERNVFVEAGKKIDLGIIRLIPIRKLVLLVSGQGVLLRINGDPYAPRGGELVSFLPEGEVVVEARSGNGKSYYKRFELKNEDYVLRISMN